MENQKTGKRSQQDIIVTILLVLLAIAAVVIIAGFIMRNVRTSGEVGEAKIDCLKLDYEIVQAINAQRAISIKRNTGGEDVNVTSIRIYVDGIWTANMTQVPAVLETRSVDASTSLLNAGQKVEIAPVLQSGTICDIEDSKVVPGSA